MKPSSGSRLVRRKAGGWLGAWMAAAALIVTGCQPLPGQSSASACVPAGPDVVCTGSGAIRGAAEGDTLAFKGIPYAKPPVGGLRWRAPEPPQPWQGVRDGSRFGAVCPQLAGKDVIGDEDCLTLNVWRPKVANAANATALPVMIFLAGGGNHAFSGQGSPGFGGVNYNGELLVPEGVVYVSFNNRLGALGFLAHGAQRGEKLSGNYGSLDQIAMLRWVQQNIAAFGGDPKRVFLFGTSAGGGSVCALMTASAARGLFHGAAMESSVPTGCELPTLADVANGTGRRLPRELRCPEKDGTACLRNKSAVDIVRALPGTFGVLPRLYGPNLDGQVFAEQPIAAIRRGAHAAMPVIIGNATQETMQWAAGLGMVTDAASYEAALAKAFGAVAAPRIREAYPLTSYSTPHLAMVSVTTDAFFTCQSRRVAQALSQSQKEPVYRYLFAHALENDAELKAQGAIHTVEHAFFFPWQGKYRPTSFDLAIQRRMVKDWTQLARAGTLADVDPTWPPVAQGDAYLQIGAASVARAGAAEAHCDFWDTVVLPWPHL
jgi:para-nitrobenzyl esterase